MNNELLPLEPAWKFYTFWFLGVPAMVFGGVFVLYMLQFFR